LTEKIFYKETSIRVIFRRKVEGENIMFTIQKNY